MAHSPRMIAGMFLAFVLALLQASAPAASKPHWQVDEHVKVCTALLPRRGQTPGLLIQSRPFASTPDLVFLVPRTGRVPRIASAKLSVGSSDTHVALTAKVTEPRGSPDRLIRTYASLDQLDRARAAGHLSISIGKNESYSVALPGFRKVLAALAQCEEQIAKRLGIAKTWTVPASEQNSFQGVVRTADYPDTMIVRDEQAGISLLLKIESSGAISECRTYELAGDARWEKVVCDVIRKRARITPARDAQGNAVGSYYVTPTIYFVLN